MLIRIRLWLACSTVAAAVAAGAVFSHAQVPEFEITPDLLDSLSPVIYHEITGLHYLLNPYQLRQFFVLESDESRRRWINRWWRSQDPTPETDVNEMRTEHDKRVRAARLKYGWEGWPGWDDRGEVLIRYGAPDFRRELDWEVSQRGAKPPGELWQYARHDMIVVFEDYNLTGRYTFALLSRGNLDRHWTAGGYPRFGSQGNAEKPIDADFDPPRAGMPPPPTNWWYVYLSEKALEQVRNFEVVLEEYPSTYPYNFNREEMPFFFGINQFKAGDSVNRVDVAVEFRAAPPPPSLKGETQKFNVTAVFFDPEFNEVERVNTKVSLPAKALPENAELWYPAQIVFSLREDYYRVAVTVEETGSGRRSSYRSTLSVNGFCEDMAISDILLCSKIAPVDKDSPFNRGALEVVPRPRGKYPHSETVPIYFELYNLDMDDNGMSSYAVEYWIVPRSPRNRGLLDRRDEGDTYAASRFESSSYGSDVPVNISIDTDNLWPGDFEFHVKLTDLRTLFVAERTTVFHLAR